MAPAYIEARVAGGKLEKLRHLPAAPNEWRPRIVLLNEPESDASKRLAWIRETYYPGLLKQGVPWPTLELIEELWSWAWGVVAWRALPKKPELLTATMCAEVLQQRALIENHILGAGYVPSKYADLERNPQFGDRLVAIYRSLLPVVRPKRGSRRVHARDRRGEDVAFSVEAAEHTANMVNERCSGWPFLRVDRPLVARDVLHRVQRRRR
jgi:hypothetical protein